MDDGEDWGDIEVAFDERVERRGLFNLALVAHELAMKELALNEKRLIFAIRRAQRARRHAERAGCLLVKAVKMMELT